MMKTKKPNVQKVKKTITKIAYVTIGISSCILLLTGKIFNILSILFCLGILEIAYLHTLIEEFTEIFQNKVEKYGKEN